MRAILTLFTMLTVGQAEAGFWSWIDRVPYDPCQFNHADRDDLYTNYMDIAKRRALGAPFEGILKIMGDELRFAHRFEKELSPERLEALEYYRKFE